MAASGSIDAPIATEQPDIAKHPSIAVLLIFVFGVTFAGNLMWNLISPFPNAVFAHDGHHYLSTCRYLTNVLLGALHGKPDFGLLFAKPFPAQLICDGPVVPGIPALVFTAIGHLALGTGWRIFVAIYSVMEALAACLVSILAMRLTNNRTAAMVSGMIFGLLPSTIVASGRYCSEVPAMLLLLCFIAALSGSRERLLKAVLAGICAGLVSLTKAVLLPVVGLCMAWTVFRSRKKLLLSSFLALSFVLTVLPWAAYTKATTGKSTITVERVPSLNASVATDLETDGWECVPPSDWMAYMMTNNDALSALTGPWLSRPGELFKLTVRKYTRLFAIPWNTFRVNVFILTPQVQACLHNLLLLAGAFGIGVYLLSGRRRLSSKAKLVGDLGLILLAVHVGFSVLQALARYAFTAMPVFPLFAGYGLSQVCWSKPRQKVGTKNLSVAACLAVLFVASVQSADWLTRLGESHEAVYRLQPGDRLEKEIVLSPRHYVMTPREVFVLVDADKNASDSEVVVNGHRVSESLRSLAQYDPWLYRNYVTRAEQTELLDIAEDDLRQWRAVPVPISWVNLSGSNQISITCGKHDCEVFGDTDPHTRSMLSPRLFAHDQMFNTISSLEPRVYDPILCARSEQTSMLVRSGGTAEKLAGAARIKLAIVCRDVDAQAPSSSLPGEYTARISPDAFNVMLRDGDAIKTNYYIFRFAPYLFGTVRLPALPPSSHLAIRVTGWIKANRAGGELGMPISVLAANDHETMLGKCPNYLKASTQWTPFNVEDLIPVSVFDGTAGRVKVALFPCHWQQAWYGCSRSADECEVKDLTLHIAAVNYPILSNGRTILY